VSSVTAYGVVGNVIGCIGAPLIGR